MISKDIDLNFLINPLTKDLNKKVGKDAIKQSIKTLMLFKLYEKPFNSDLYTNISELLFENYVIDGDEEMESRIIKIINKYEPRVNISFVNVISDVNTNKINITVGYIYSNDPEETLKISLERIQ